jgi:ribosome-binding factor A
MPKSTKRIHQVADMIQRYLSQALRQEIKDPRLANVAITEVVVSPDLRNAKIYFSLINESALKETEEALRRAAGHFRHIVATNIDLRYTPVLNFYYDETIPYAERLERLMNNINENKNEEN